MNKLSNYVRPVVTIIWTWVIAYCLIAGVPVPAWAETLYIGIITYYFAERAALKVPGKE